MKQVGYYRAGRRDKKKYPIMIEFVEEGMLLLIMEKLYNSVVANFSFSDIVDSAIQSEGLRGDWYEKVNSYSTYGKPKYKQYQGWVIEPDFIDEFWRVFTLHMKEKHPTFKLFLDDRALKQQLLLGSI